MARGLQNRTFKLLLAALLLPCLSMQEAMACSGATYANSCINKVKELAVQNQAIGAVFGARADAAGNNINNAANDLSTATQMTAAGAEEATKACQDQLNQCRAACNGPSDASQKKICEDNIGKQIANLEVLKANSIADSGAAANSAVQSGADPAPASGASLGDTINKILPLATMGVMLCMAMKCTEKKQDPNAANQSALLPNGAIDCSKADAGQYADCDQYLMGQCGAQVTMVSMTPNCQGFTQRFCAEVRAPDGVQQVQLENGAIVAINLGGAGAGNDSPYCQNTYASAYCASGGATAQCPACLQLQASQSTVCRDNPAACLAQNSPQQIAAAKPNCPGDPSIALYERLNAGSQAGAFTGGQGAPVTGGPPSTGGPPPILPPNATETLASTPGAAGGVSTSSALREGQTGFVPGANSAGGGVGGAVTGGLQKAAKSGLDASGREIAGTGGVATASMGSGPASDVQGQFGPSLFAMGSQAIRNRCQQKRINNCP